MIKKAYNNLVTVALPLVILLLYGLLGLQEDLRAEVPMLVGITGCIVIILTWLYRRASQDHIDWPPWLIIVVALLIRLFFLLKQPQLSDDIYRYLWDGLQSLKGQNPYALSPDVAMQNLATAPLLAAKVNHPEMVTIYPPAAQFVFLLGAALDGSVLGMKLLLVGLDIGSCGLMVRLCARLGTSPWRSVLYAWHPLPVLEVASSGHIDGAGIFFLLCSLSLCASLLLAPKEKKTNGLHAWQQDGLILASGFLFCCALLVKLYPLIFLPQVLILLTNQRLRALFLLGLAAGFIFLTLPFTPHITNSLQTLTIYARDWEFSGFAFRWLRNIFQSGLVVRWVLSIGLATTVAGLSWKLRNQINGLPESHQKERFNVLFKAWSGVSIAFLLLTPTLHPWYALYLAATLPLAAGPSPVVLSWAVFLAYQVQIPYSILGEWIESDTTALMIFLAPIVAYGAVVAGRRMDRSG